MCKCNVIMGLRLKFVKAQLEGGMEDEQLQAGEYSINRYTVRFARFTSRGWNTNGPWMRLVVTNRRLMFLPNDQHSANTYLIERPKLHRCWNAAMGRRNGIIIELHDGELIHMYVDWAQGDKLVKDIREMMSQPTKPRITPRQLDKPLVN